MAFSLQGVSFSYGRVPVLSAFNLSVEGSGVVGLLGPNGAGKSTVLRLLATSAVPDKGSVELFGLDPTDPAQRQRIRARLGYAPQGRCSIGSVRVIDYLEYIAWLKKIPREEIPTRVKAMAKKLEVAPLLSRRLSKLSGGQRRRVEVAQAFLNHPDLVLLDEPTAGLDPEHRILFRKWMRTHSEAATVVLATHLVDDVATVCDRVLIMLGGRVMFDGSPDELAGLAGRPTAGITPMEAGYRAAMAGARGDYEGRP
ncbi:MAG: ABC transporter ATP-binding protein [Acidimicrobiia bacterium]